MQFSFTIFAASTILFVFLLASTFIPQQNEAGKIIFHCKYCDDQVVIDGVETGYRVIFILKVKFLPKSRLKIDMLHRKNLVYGFILSH
jgi:hypothetical protein